MIKQRLGIDGLLSKKTYSNTYDALGRLSAVLDEGVPIRNYYYDSLGNLAHRAIGNMAQERELIEYVVEYGSKLKVGREAQARLSVLEKSKEHE